MACNNPALQSAKESKDALKDLMTQGKDALASINESVSGLTDSLNSFVPDLGESPESLQDAINDLKGSETIEAFNAKMKEIDEKYGEAWDNMETELNELGLGSFPPAYDKVATFVKDKSGVDVNALLKGDFSSVETAVAKATDGSVQPDISGILAGDFSSLGIELPDFDAEPDPLCKAIPNITIKEGEEAETNASKPLAAKIPPIKIPKFDSSKMNDYIAAGMMFSRCQSSVDKWVDTNLDDQWLQYFLSADDLKKKFMVAKTKQRIKSTIIAYYRRRIAEDHYKISYDEFMARLKKSTNISYEETIQIAETFVNHDWDITTFYYKRLKFAYQMAFLEGTVKLPWDDVVIHIYDNRFPKEEENLF